MPDLVRTYTEVEGVEPSKWTAQFNRRTLAVANRLMPKTQSNDWHLRTNDPVYGYGYWIDSFTNDQNLHEVKWQQEGF